MDKRYVRTEVVLFIEVQEGETPEEAEDRFLDSLPDGIDCASIRSAYWTEE